MTKNKHILILVQRILLIVAICLFAAESVNAQDSLSRPVTSVYRLEGGATNARSTYLSPLRYSGTLWGVTGEWTKAFQKKPEHLIMSFAGAMNYRNMLNPPHSARMLGFDAKFNWGMAYRWRMPNNIQLAAGALLDINGGALYLTRNGNNPVTVIASAGIDIDLSVSWHFKIGRLPILVSDRLQIPSLGAFFSPEYGETLFEIYLGNRKGLAHCGWWGNNFGAGNLLSFKLDFGRTAMELGYRYDFRSFYANHLITRTAVNSFVIGVIPQGLGLKRKTKANYAGY